MVAHTVLLGGVDDRIAVHHEAGTHGEVAGLGEVVDHRLSLGRTDEGDVVVGVVSIVDDAHGDPLAVGRPGEVDLSVALHLIPSVGDLALLLRLGIVDHEATAVFEIGEVLAIGGKLGAGLLRLVTGDEEFLIDQRAVGEVRVVTPLDRGDVEVTLAIALARIDDRAVVAKGDTTLGGGGIGDALRGGVVG